MKKEEKKREYKQIKIYIITFSLYAYMSHYCKAWLEVFEASQTRHKSRQPQPHAATSEVWCAWRFFPRDTSHGVRTCEVVAVIIGRKSVAADIGEGVEDEGVLGGGVEVKEALKKLLQIGLREDLLLEYHLQHGVPEILIRILRLLLHRHAVHQLRALLRHRNHIANHQLLAPLLLDLRFPFRRLPPTQIAGSGAAGCQAVPAGGGGFGLRGGLVCLRGLGPPTPAAVCSEHYSKETSFVGRHN